MIQSLTRAMEILELMGSADKEFSIAELSRGVGLPASTVHRILKTFCEGGFAVKGEKTHLYRPGSALIPLGMAAAAHLNLREEAVSVMKKLMEKTSEDTFLAIVSGYKGLMLEKVEGPSNLKVIERFGIENDLHCGAIRKTLLAYQSEEFIQRYLEEGPLKSEKYTDADKKEFLTMLEQIRNDGVAITIGDYIEDAAGIGAPVFDQNNNIAASIGIIVPHYRFSDEHAQLCKEMVVKYARKLSERLGSTRKA